MRYLSILLQAMGRILPLASFLVIMIAACQNDSQSSLADELTLDATHPTFVFFYTDG